MFKSLTIISLLATTLSPAATGDRPEIDFTMIYEENVTDDDAEVVISVNTDEGIDRFVLFGSLPRRPFLSLMSTDGESLGLAEVLLESAEPSVAAVQAAYPQGPYFAFFRTTSGQWIGEVTTLSHELPSAPVLTHPTPGMGLPARGAVVTWAHSPAVESWGIELEHDDLGLSLNVVLPGRVHSFAIPDGFLVKGEEFELGISATSRTGNVIVVETAFEVE